MGCLKLLEYLYLLFGFSIDIYYIGINKINIYFYE